MHYKKLFLMGLLLCTQAFAARIEEVKADDVVTDQVDMGSHAIQLPSGQWHVIARSKHNGTDVFGKPFPVRNILLAQYRKTELLALLRITSPLGDLKAFGRNSWKDDPCSHLKSVYMQDNLDGNYRLPECVYVKPVLGFGSSADSYWQDAMRRIQITGVSPPPVMVGADYNYYRDGGFVHVSAWLNPELAGVPRDASRTAIDSKWGTDNLGGVYKNFADQAGVWAHTMAAAVKSSYNGTLQAIPELPYATTK